jgi:2-hydroxycyclohexanecarboxyl-CoA dehydrogenase
MARIKNTNRDSRKAATLSSRVALVTGGSRGIGRAIAQRLASLGASVAICGHDPTALEDTAGVIAKLGMPVFSQVTDVTRASAVADLVAKTEAALGPITILVNNAGIGLFGPTHERTESD